MAKYHENAFAGGGTPQQPRQQLCRKGMRKRWRKRIPGSSQSSIRSLFSFLFFFLARATTTIGSMAKSWIRLLCAKRRSRCIVCSSGCFLYVYAKIECVPTVLCTAAIDSKMRWKKRRSSGCWIDRALYELHWTFKGKEEENADE